MPLTRQQKLLGVLAVALGAFAVVQRKNIVKIGATVFDATKALAFRAALTAATPNGRAAKYSDTVLKVASEEQVSPFLIVAIMERESHSGDALTPTGPTGTGDSGHGRGLMQLDDRTKGGTFHGAVIADGRWQDPYWNMKAAVVDHIKPDQSYFTGKGLTGDALLRATVAAYNTGAGNVWKSIQAGKSPDTTTAGGDYSADVLSRLASISQAFQSRSA